MTQRWPQIDSAVGRWEGLDRSLRRVDAVLNEAARSTGLELDRVCDGSAGGMLGGLTQMPPPPPSRECHAMSLAEMPNEVIHSDADGVLGHLRQSPPVEIAHGSAQHEQATDADAQRPSQARPRARSDPGASLPAHLPAADSPSSTGKVMTEEPLLPPLGGCIPGSSQHQAAGSPSYSGCDGAGVLTQQQPESPVTSPRHTPREEWSEDHSAGETQQQESQGLSSRDDGVQSSPRHTPRTQGTQDRRVSAVKADAAPPTPTRSSSPECVIVSSDTKATTPQCSPARGVLTNSHHLDICGNT